jgi:hypothetical protein
MQKEQRAKNKEQRTKNKEQKRKKNKIKYNEEDLIFSHFIICGDNVW